jgi:hypothetical protein
MTLVSHLTVGQIATFFREPEWRVRRVVDSLGCEIPRAGRYRMIPREMLPAIGARLEKRHAAAEVPA